MFYSPQHYKLDPQKEELQKLSLQVINENAFASLISFEPSPVSSSGQSPAQAPEPQYFVTQLPLLLDYRGEDIYLIGHMARANPHWKSLSQQRKIFVLFQGPSSYISPAWYIEREDNVPTWNYVSVHVNGEFSIVSDPGGSYEILHRLTKKYESIFATGWRLPDQVPPALEPDLKAIVSFEIKITSMNGKFKLSQKQSPEERTRVIEGLKTIGQSIPSAEQKVGDWMQKFIDEKK